MPLDAYFGSLEKEAPRRWYGSVVEANGLTISSDGPVGSVGDGCRIVNAGGQEYDAEVIGFRGPKLVSMPLESPRGIRLGDKVYASGVAPS